VSAINHETILGLNDGARRYSKIPDAPSIPSMPTLKPTNCDKNSEIEKIKRQLHNLIDRVDALKSK